MADQSVGSDPYEAVISDLTAKRDQLDNLIKTLVAFRAAPGTALTGAPWPAVAAVQKEGPLENAAIGAGDFLGMSIVDAARKLLLMRKRAMTNAEILAEIKAGGVVLSGADPLNVVGSVLTRRFGQVGDVVRVARGTWGLKEWYPNRSFKPAVKDPAPVAAYSVQINDLGGDPLSDEDDDL